MWSPTRSVPVCTSIRASTPRLRSSSASTTTPTPGRFGFAFNSATSATSSMLSSRSGMPSPALAETSTSITSPPHFSTTNSCSERLAAYPLGVGVGAVHLVDGHDDRHFRRLDVVYRLHGLRHHAVVRCDDEHRDVRHLCAPRARMAVNASWPGVSMNVTGVPLCTTWYAPMCCVMPPASLATTFVRRMASSRVVLAVVDVTQHRYDGGPGFEVGGLVLRHAAARRADGVLHLPCGVPEHAGHACCGIESR